jgi:hypothetical protein
MAIDPFLQWYEGTPLGAALRSADPLVMQLSQLFHIFGLVILLASALLLSLRLYGALLPAVPVPRLLRTVQPFLLGGLAAALLSGLVMFLSVPGLYNISPAFWPKISLLGLAIVVQLAFLRVLWGEPSPALARGGAALSLLLWVGVGAFGRAIAYVS